MSVPMQEHSEGCTCLPCQVWRATDEYLAAQQRYADVGEGSIGSFAVARETETQARVWRGVMLAVRREAEAIKRHHARYTGLPTT